MGIKELKEKVKMEEKDKIKEEVEEDKKTILNKIKNKEFQFNTSEIHWDIAMTGNKKYVKKPLDIKQLTYGELTILDRLYLLSIPSGNKTEYYTIQYIGHILKPFDMVIKKITEEKAKELIKKYLLNGKDNLKTINIK